MVGTNGNTECQIRNSHVWLIQELKNHGFPISTRLKWSIKISPAVFSKRRKKVRLLQPEYPNWTENNSIHIIFYIHLYWPVECCFLMNPIYIKSNHYISHNSYHILYKTLTESEKQSDISKGTVIESGTISNKKYQISRKGPTLLCRVVGKATACRAGIYMGAGSKPAC